MPPPRAVAKSVGLKRFGDESHKWFCEECRIGGRIRSYRLANRDAPAVIWAALPSLASFGTLPDGTTVFAAYGRLFVGRGTELYAYYSEASKVRLGSLLASTMTQPQRSPHGKDENEPSNRRAVQRCHSRLCPSPVQPTPQCASCCNIRYTSPPYILDTAPRRA